MLVSRFSIMRLYLKSFLLVLSGFALISCFDSDEENLKSTQRTTPSSNMKSDSIPEEPKILEFDRDVKTIHLMVALCDNVHQGIVPVPKSIGNGQDPKSNLYWGAAYGVKTYFKRSAQWTLLKSEKESDVILERLVFKHKTKDVYLVADAYDGRNIKNSIEDFLSSTSGELKDTLNIDNKTIGIQGNARLVSYVGHNGLMEFNVEGSYDSIDNELRDVIILACISKNYFEPYLDLEFVNPLVWSTGLMAPEAYIIHDALAGYVNEESNEQIRERAAKAYSKFQKCSLKAAKNLLVTN